MIMNNWFEFGFHIHYWSSSYLGWLQDHIGMLSHLDFGYFAWSTQLTKSITFPKAVTQKYNMVYICSKHAQDQYCGFSFESLAPVLQKKVIIIT